MKSDLEEQKRQIDKTYQEYLSQLNTLRLRGYDYYPDIDGPFTCVQLIDSQIRPYGGFNAKG